MSRTDPDLNRLYSIPQAAAEFGMLPRTWRSIFDSRAVPLVRIGRRLYVRHADAIAYLEQQTIPARPATEAVLAEADAR